MFRRLLFLCAESADVRLRHSGHMLPASEEGMVYAAESDEVCSVGFLEEGLFFFSGSCRVWSSQARMGERRLPFFSADECSAGRWVELLQSRVSLLNQLARCREGCSARASKGFELLSSCRARRVLTVFDARRHRVGWGSQGFRTGTCCRRAPASNANPRTHIATRLLSPSLISTLGTSCSIGRLGHAIVR